MFLLVRYACIPQTKEFSMTNQLHPVSIAFEIIIHRFSGQPLTKSQQEMI